MKYLVLLSVLFVSACSLLGNKDALEPAELVEFEPTAELTRLWSIKAKGGQGKGYTRLVPVIKGDTLYVAGHKGFLVAVNRTTGKKHWAVTLDEPLSSGVGLSVDRLLFGTDNGELIALSADDGKELWRKQLSSEIMSPPVGDGTVVAVQTLDGKLMVLDAGTGEVVWFYENLPPALTLRGRPAPILTPSVIYAAFSNGRLIAFDAKNGLILWEQRIAMPEGRSDLDKMVDIQATPILRDGIIYVSSFQGRLVALTRVSGRPLWAIKSSSYQALLLRGTTLFVAAEDSSVSAYNANSGEVLWTNDQLIRRRITGVEAIGAYVAVADEEGYLHILNAQDGSFVARTRVDGSGVRASLVSDGEILYAYANDGTLNAYKVSEFTVLEK